ncbi:MAG: hypothetical protein Q9204_006038 [Flavoplaca sp. TL-2023a]
MSTDRMGLVHFGWSAGDILKAIEIIWGIAEAFDNAKGAKAKYATSSAFLRALVPVLQRILQCLESPDDSPLQEDILVQAEIILEAYFDFEGYLNKRTGLVSPGQGTSGKLRYITQTVLSAFDEMQGKVQNLQGRVVNAMAFIGTILAFEIKAKIDDVSKTLGQSSEDNQTRFTELLESIESQSRSLQVLSSDYKTQLEVVTKENNQGREDEMAKIENNLESVKLSQENLRNSLELLTQQIDEQHRESSMMSPAQAETWAKLSHYAEMQTKHLDEAKDSTPNTIAQTESVFASLGNITGNPSLRQISTRLGGIRSLYVIVAGYFSPLKTKPSHTVGHSSDGSQGTQGESMYRTPKPKATITGPSCFHKANEMGSKVSGKDLVQASLYSKQPLRKSSAELRTIPPDQLLAPPSRKGQRPFVASRPSRRSRPCNIRNNINSEGLAAPPLPPRSSGGFEVRARSADSVKMQSSPAPKSPSLSLLSPPTSFHARSSSSSLEVRGEGIPKSQNTLQWVSQARGLAMPRSSYDSVSSEQSRSPNGTVPSPTTTKPCLADLETDVLDEEYEDGGLLGSPESLPFADRRKRVEHLISKPRVTFMKKD